MNKKLITIGTAAGILMPVAGIVSCGQESLKHYDLLPTYTGQADQLIALGIGSDYYPLQLNEKEPYEYLTNPGKYMYAQSPDFKNNFSKRIKELMPKEKGTSWWNQQALDSDEDGSDPAYWQKVEGSLMLYEHYLLDDDEKIIDNSKAPKHKNESVIQTNFRSSRDPFTRIPKGVFYGWDLSDDELSNIFNTGTPISDQRTSNVAVDKESAKIIKELRSIKYDSNGVSTWTYNDKYFVDSYHRMFLDNAEFQGSNFKKWIVDSSIESPFTSKTDGANAKIYSDYIKNLFDASTYRSEEVKIGIGPKSTKGGQPGPHHHPIYEQQEGEIGAAPMFEGAMRDNQLYLFNVAWQLDNLVTCGTPYGKQHYEDLPKTISQSQRDNNKKIAQSQEEANKVKKYLENNLKDKQITSIKNAFKNANKITNDIWTRIENLRKYFEALKKEVGQTTPLTFGLFTIAPGHGESTIQTMSKYSFIYRDLGFAQPIPSNIKELSDGASTYLNDWVNGANTNLNEDGKINGNKSDVKEAIGENALFNMDDNGWFWTLGASGNLSTQKMEKFKGQFDIGVIAARDTDFDSNVKNVSTNSISAAKMFKGQNSLNVQQSKSFLESKKVNYDLWNEGLKTPFVMHMILDKIQVEMETWAKSKKPSIDINDEKFKRGDAKSWGDYFNKDFINGDK